MCADLNKASNRSSADFRAAVFTASMEVEDATGAPASVVFASTALMTAIGGWESFYPAPYSVQNVSGVATASTLQVNVSGLRVVRAKWLDTDADGIGDVCDVCPETAGTSQADRDLGPIITAKQQARVRSFIDAARRNGLKPAGQGNIAADAPAGGFYVAPVLFADVPQQHPLVQEEVFGPVLVASAFRDEAEAVELANGTPYGLVAGVWTRDGARQMRMARHLAAGQVFINNYGAGGGVELPFGGMKHSGYGREKGFEALLGFTCLKTIALRHG